MGTVRKIPMRKCVGCGEMKSKKEMMRVLKTTEDEIILDATGRKNGRGAYLCFQKSWYSCYSRSEEQLCFQKSCLLQAIKNKGLERSLKMAIPKSVYENLEKEFENLEHS